MPDFAHVQPEPLIETDAAVQDSLRASGPIPRHVAVIMDGNGRWARARGLARIHGHNAGVEAVRDTVEACAQLGVEFLTLYTFSTENWRRPVTEVDALMRLLVGSLRSETKKLLENRIQLRTIGDADALPARALRELRQAIRETSTEDARMTLTLALSYSARWEITEAARSLCRAAAEGSLRPEDVDESRFSAYLATAGMPDPDLLIRTGGEQRLSNFLLWQLAYAELYITDEFWPDFRRQHLYKAIRSFQQRERRFGRISEK